MPVDPLVIRARNGDKNALSALLETIREPMFQLSLRMLAYPSDAEDATQEILIKVMTNLSRFQGKASFKTWVYKIGIHHILNIKRKRADKLNISFQSWEDCIYADRGRVRLENYDDQEQALLVNEVRTGCLQGLLLCLEKEVRTAFILGEVFEFTGRDGAWILDITPEAFRQRLSRGRRKIKAFLVKNCGFMDEANPCKCREQAERDINTGMINPDRLDFIDTGSPGPGRAEDIGPLISELDDMGKMIALFRSYPKVSAPPSLAGLMKDLIASGDFCLFQ